MCEVGCHSLLVRCCLCQPPVAVQSIWKEFVYRRRRFFLAWRCSASGLWSQWPCRKHTVKQSSSPSNSRKSGQARLRTRSRREWRTAFKGQPPAVLYSWLWQNAWWRHCKEGQFVLAHNLRIQSATVGKSCSRSRRPLVMLYLCSGNRERWVLLFSRLPHPFIKPRPQPMSWYCLLSNWAGLLPQLNLSRDASRTHPESHLLSDCPSIHVDDGG